MVRGFSQSRTAAVGLLVVVRSRSCRKVGSFF